MTIEIDMRADGNDGSETGMIFKITTKKMNKGDLAKAVTMLEMIEAQLLQNLISSYDLHISGPGDGKEKP